MIRGVKKKTCGRFLKADRSGDRPFSSCRNSMCCEALKVICPGAMPRPDNCLVCALIRAAIFSVLLPFINPGIPFSGDSPVYGWRLDLLHRVGSDTRLHRGDEARVPGSVGLGLQLQFTNGFINVAPS